MSADRPNFRKRIYEIIELSSADDKPGVVYDFTMLLVILVSLVPLLFKESNTVFVWIDRITSGIFVIDYLLRLMTADYKLKRGALSFLFYPLTFMAVIDLLAILPTFSILSAGMKSLKIFRMFRTFRAFRALRVAKAFKIFRYSKSLSIIISVIREQRTPLLAVCTLAMGYILIAALVIFNVEPDTFDSYFDAIYWATVSLTTMGYGDIYPISDAGRVVTMLSSFVGIAIVALPSGIITAGYMQALRERKDDEDE